MKILPFKASPAVTIGVELEYQIINPRSFTLASRAKDLIRNIRESRYNALIKPEITQSMIEINSSIHHSIGELSAELLDLQDFLVEKGRLLDVAFCGGGTHPFQKWTVQKIFPAVRYRHLSRKYKYLSKRSTVFGQHIHIGCASAEDALYLTHALARYAPHFIAICASSPFYMGIDTGFFSSRSTIFNAFPTSGVIPYLENWQEFSAYFYKMRGLKVISTMKDFYWDIRPKPEFGTVEIRVCDVPLAISTTLIITAYVQSLALYLLENKPDMLNRDLYYLYACNRFQASRYAFEGEIIDPYTLQQYLIRDDILATIKMIERSANKLNNMAYLSQLITRVINNDTDAVRLRNILKQSGSYPRVVEEQCMIWTGRKS